MKNRPKQQKSELRANKKRVYMRCFRSENHRAENQLQKFIHKLTGWQNFNLLFSHPARHFINQLQNYGRRFSHGKRELVANYRIESGEIGKPELETDCKSYFSSSIFSTKHSQQPLSDLTDTLLQDEILALQRHATTSLRGPPYALSCITKSHHFY